MTHTVNPYRMAYTQVPIFLKIFIFPAQAFRQWHPQSSPWKTTRFDINPKVNLSFSFHISDICMLICICKMYMFMYCMFLEIHYQSTLGFHSCVDARHDFFFYLEVQITHYGFLLYFWWIKKLQRPYISPLKVWNQW